MSQTFTVSKNTLLEKVKYNRETHRTLFLAALDGYKKAVISDLEFTLNQIKEGKLPDVRINRVRPSDHTHDYDNIITMLEMAITENVEVTVDQIACFVNDDWEWQRQWSASNSSYTDTSIYSSKF